MENNEDKIDHGDYRRGIEERERLERERLHRRENASDKDIKRIILCAKAVCWWSAAILVLLFLWVLLRAMLS